MNLLFCGDIFSNFESGTSFRSGIFFVASALLKEFIVMEDVTVTVYSSGEKKKAVEIFLKKNYPQLTVKTLRPLPHRSFCKYLKKRNAARKGNGLRALKGSGKLIRICEMLDRFYTGGDAKCFREYDAFFSPCEAAPKAIEKTGMPIYTVIHDLIPIVTGEFPVSKGYWLYDVMQQVSREKYYFCISECTKRDFLEYCHKADPEKVRVIYNGYTAAAGAPGKEKTEQILAAAGLQPKRYILILGNVVPHKNVSRQLSAGVRFIRKAGLSDFRIAVVGSCNDPKKILQSAKIPEEDKSLIVFCGYVPDDHIRAYYSGAFCLSFTSLYEGFGLPVLEAMQEGCPVVTSNTSSLPEVAGNAAICISPVDEEAHIEAYTGLLVDEKLREELISRGRERVKRFTWTNTAKQMMDGMKNDRTV